MADPELIKEIMVDLGENLEHLGYDGVLETVEGHGRIGKACRNCRYDEDVQIVAWYMKDVAKTFLREPPSEKLNMAKQCLDQAWHELKAALREDAVSAQNQPAQRRLPAQAPQLPVRRK